MSDEENTYKEILGHSPEESLERALRKAIRLDAGIDTIIDGVKIKVSPGEEYSALVNRFLNLRDKDMNERATAILESRGVPAGIKPAETLVSPKQNRINLLIAHLPDAIKLGNIGLVQWIDDFCNTIHIDITCDLPSLAATLKNAGYNSSNSTIDISITKNPDDLAVAIVGQAIKKFEEYPYGKFPDKQLINTYLLWTALDRHNMLFPWNDTHITRADGRPWVNSLGQKDSPQLGKR